MRAATPNVPPTMSNTSMTDTVSSGGKGGLLVSFATPTVETAGVDLTLAVGDGMGDGVGDGPGRIICVCARKAPVASVTLTIAVDCVGSRLIGKRNAPVMVPFLSDASGVSSSCEEIPPTSRDSLTGVP